MRGYIPMDSKDKPVNKREKVLTLLDPTRPPSYIPAAFFLHFPQDCHRGQAAIDKHLEYFRHTDMDIVKIQYEFAFPRLPEIRSPGGARVPPAAMLPRGVGRPLRVRAPECRSCTSCRPGRYRTTPHPR